MLHKRYLLAAAVAGVLVVSIAVVSVLSKPKFAAEEYKLLFKGDVPVLQIKYFSNTGGILEVVGPNGRTIFSSRISEKSSTVLVNLANKKCNPVGRYEVLFRRDSKTIFSKKLVLKKPTVDIKYARAIARCNGYCHIRRVDMKISNVNDRPIIISRIRIKIDNRTDVFKITIIMAPHEETTLSLPLSISTTNKNYTIGVSLEDNCGVVLGSKIVE